MFAKCLTRRQFINYGKLSFLFLLNSCSNVSKKIKISFQSSFYPESFKDSLPSGWKKENINFGDFQLEKNKTKLLNSDFTLINDGWINSINFEEFQDINDLFLFNKLDGRSKDFLNIFEENQRNKLLPIGIVPYAVIIKNNKDLITYAEKSWDFLLSSKLTGKVIFPRSPRIIMSIARKISGNNSLLKLKGQAMLFEDKNSLNWLINSDACVAILPYSLCFKYFKIDSRLSMVFPKTGVPLMWHFLLSKTKKNNGLLIEWVKSLESKKIIDKLVTQGWYLPIKNKYLQEKYYMKKHEVDISGPSKICWENSWSFSPLDDQEKLNLENLWNKSSSP